MKSEGYRIDRNIWSSNNVFEDRIAIRLIRSLGVHGRETEGEGFVLMSVSHLNLNHDAQTFLAIHSTWRQICTHHVIKYILNKWCFCFDIVLLKLLLQKRNSLWFKLIRIANYNIIWILNFLNRHCRR